MQKLKFSNCPRPPCVGMAFNDGPVNAENARELQGIVMINNMRSKHENNCEVAAS